MTATPAFAGACFDGVYPAHDAGLSVTVHARAFKAGLSVFSLVVSPFTSQPASTLGFSPTWSIILEGPPREGFQVVLQRI
jgi:hypothetical protein